MKLKKDRPTPPPTREQLTAKLIVARAEATHLDRGTPEWELKQAEIDGLLDDLLLSRS